MVPAKISLDVAAHSTESSFATSLPRSSAWASVVDRDGDHFQPITSKWWNVVTDTGKKLKEGVDREIENVRQAFGGASDQVASIERAVHHVARSAQFLSQHILSTDSSMHLQLEDALQDTRRTLEADHRSDGEAAFGHDARRQQIAHDLDVVFTRVYDVLRPLIALSSEEFAKELDGVRQTIETLLVVIGG